MKEIKKFFDKDIQLNKGYIPTNTTNYSENNNLLNKKITSVLPPIEVLAEYEEIHPGTLAKILELTHNEQSHRHKLELAVQANTDRCISLANNISTMIAVIAIFLVTGIFGWLLASSFIVFGIIASVAGCAIIKVTNFKDLIAKIWQKIKSCKPSIGSSNSNPTHVKPNFIRNRPHSNNNINSNPNSNPNNRRRIRKVNSFKKL